MIIGVLVTIPLQDHSRDGKEIGIFELPVNISEELFNNSPDKKAIVKKTIAAFLASAILDTEVPQEYWALKVAPVFRKEFNWPENMTFEV